MVPGALIFGAALLAADPAPRPLPGPPPVAVLTSYEERSAGAGKDPAAHARLALWCEANGLPSGRSKHLALAVLRDPTNALARGLLGLVDFRGHWCRPEEVSAAVENDPARAAVVALYLEKRAQTPDTGEAQYKLGAWCEQNNLKDEAKAHFLAATRLEPTRDAAWKRLGYRKHNGQWVSDDRSAAAKQDADLQKKADHRWRPALETARNGLASRHKERRGSAEDALARVTDPRAVPSVCAVFGASADPETQAVAVRVLGQIDAAGASRALAVLALSARSAEARRAAAETLKRRDPREFADLLIASILEPIKYEIKAVGGQGKPGSLSVNGKEANLKRIYTPPPVQMPAILPTDQFGFDAAGNAVVYRQVSGTYINFTPLRYTTGGVSPQFASGFPAFLAGHGGGAAGQAAAQTAVKNARQSGVGNTSVLGASNGVYAGRNLVNETDIVQIPVGQLIAQAEYANAAARRAMDNDIDQIETYNRAVAASNDRVLPVLAGVAGQDFGTDLASWRNWWVDQIGMRILPQKSQDPTTVIEQVPIDFQPQPAQPVLLAQASITQRLASCFAAGTPVQTRTGPRPIESLKVGDVVLTQSVQTGALGYQPIVKVHHNPPSATYKIALGGETVVSSAFHRFWAPGRGWVMARDLKPGDTLRTVGGLASVSAVADDRVQPVFNLDVADDADFFVGRTGALVHDNTLPDLRLEPFDAPTAVAAATTP